MPEYWFRYGVTEVSVELSEEVRHWRVGAGLGEPGGLEALKDFVEGLGGEVTVLYDHSGGRGLRVLRTLIAELEAAGRRYELVASAWRLDRRAAEEELPRSLRGLGGFKAAWRLGGEVERLSSRELVVVSEAEPHGVLGRVAVREVFTESGLGHLWERLAGSGSVKAVCLVGRRLMVGEAVRVDEEAKQLVEKEYETQFNEQATIVIASGGGWPRDATLESCIHILRLLRPLVEDSGMIGLVAECRLGLGSPKLIEALLGESRDERYSRLGGVVRELREEGVRLALTSTLPKSLAAKLLSSRSFDTVQELLSYGLRLYSREARVALVEEPLRLFKSRGGRS